MVTVYVKVLTIISTFLTTSKYLLDILNLLKRHLIVDHGL